MSVDSAIRSRSTACAGMLLVLVLIPAVAVSAGEQYIALPKVDGVAAPSSSSAAPAASAAQPSTDQQALAVVPDPPVAADPPRGSSSEQSTVVPRAAPAVLTPTSPAALSPVPSVAPGVPGNGLFGPSIAPQGQATSSPTVLGVLDKVLEWTGPGCCPMPNFGNRSMSGHGCLCDSQNLYAPPMEYAPNFMGDLQVPGGYVLYSTNPRLAKYVPLPIAGGDGGFKISDNDNPIPTSRLFFEYNHATNALQDTTPDGKLNFDRYTLGIEQVLCWEGASVELRLPIAQGLISDLGPAEASGTAFGNIPLVFKQVLWSGDDAFLSGGVAVVTPTAPEAVIHTPSLLTYVVRNESVHLDPFVGVLFKPDPRVFIEGFLQVDMIANGDAVFQNVAGTLNKLGVYQAQTLMSVDLKAGYWLYRGPEANILTGVAPSVELHYTTTLQNADTAGPVTNPFNHADVLDLTAGLHVELDRGTDLSVGVSVPLKTTAGDRPNDSELIVQLNQRY